MRRLIAVLVVFTSFVFAQQVKDYKPSAAQAGMQMPQPAPEMEKLTKALTGNWLIQEKVFPGPFAPQGANGKGSESIKRGPGGFSLLMDYQGSALGPFTGHGITTWSPDTKQYETAWVDSFTPGGIFTMTGKWQGDTMVFTGVDMSTGSPLQTRHTYSNITPTSFTYTMEMGPSADKMQKFMEMQYRRTSVGAERKRRPEPSGASKR